MLGLKLNHVSKRGRWKPRPCLFYMINTISNSKVHGTDRTKVGPMLAPWTLLSGMVTGWALALRRASVTIVFDLVIWDILAPVPDGFTYCSTIIVDDKCTILTKRNLKCIVIGSVLLKGGSSWLPAQWASGFSGDHQQDHQCLCLLLCYSFILSFIACILLGIKLLLLLLSP